MNDPVTYEVFCSLSPTWTQPSNKCVYRKYGGQCCCCSGAQSCLLFATPRTAARQASLSFTTSQSLLKLMSIQSMIHPTISSSVVPFSSCLQSFPASGSFPVSQLFASGGQSIGVSASTSGLTMNIWYWSPLKWTDWISLQSKVHWPPAWSCTDHVTNHELIT